MANVKFINMMTHDDWNPFECGFVLLTHLDENGDRLVDHNGFENIDRQTFEDFKAIMEMLEIQLKINESKLTAIHDESQIGKEK